MNTAKRILRQEFAKTHREPQNPNSRYPKPRPENKTTSVPNKICGRKCCWNHKLFAGETENSAFICGRFKNEENSRRSLQRSIWRSNLTSRIRSNPPKPNAMRRSRRDLFTRIIIVAARPRFRFDSRRNSSLNPQPQFDLVHRRMNRSPRVLFMRIIIDIRGPQRPLRIRASKPETPKLLP